jgi:hypothetical protein
LKRHEWKYKALLIWHRKYVHQCFLEVTNLTENITNGKNLLLTENKQDLITLIQSTLQINNFHFNNQYYKQNDELAMGAAVSNHRRNIHSTPKLC